jgi:hypothetical protein
VLYEIILAEMRERSVLAAARAVKE